ncbi:MAG: hypothetical protein M3Q13_03855, partial [Pseudomonadota bacterium]|nr:hypothetical protein [Pseudomonadota bacterium]
MSDVLTLVQAHALSGHPVPGHAASAHVASRTRRLTLLGTGTVGRAFVARYQRLRTAGLLLPELALIANSRDARSCANDIDAAFGCVETSSRRRDSVQLDDESLKHSDIIIDATA